MTPHGRPHRCLPASGGARRGAALIIALVVLAALLMLGLPFLFTQSASLTGTRAFSHNQSAYIGRDAAENLGVAAGAMVVINSFKGTTGSTGTEQWTSLVDKLVWNKGLPVNPPMPANWAVMLSDNRVGLNLSTMPGFNGTPTLSSTPSAPGVQTSNIKNTTVIGLSIEDEAGKLDPNSLTVAGWDALFKQVGIDDWDDNQSANSRATYNSQQQQYVQYYDDDNYGELAAAMAAVRLYLPGRRITQLEQLLQADTLNWSGNQGSWSSPSASPPPQPGFGLRRPLTRSELDLLRPYLTLHNPSQGRGSANPNSPPPPFGLGKEAVIDIGTVSMIDPPSWANGGNYVYFVDAQSVSTFDHAAPVMSPQSQPTLIGMGTWVTTDQVDQNGPNRGIATQVFRSYPGTPINPGSKVTGASVQMRVQATRVVTTQSPLVPNMASTTSTYAIGIEAPPTVNLNAAGAVVRGLYGLTAQPALPKPFMTQDALRAVNSTLVANGFQQSQFTQMLCLDLQNPLSTSYIPALGVQQIIDKRLTELPPLGISSPGVFTVISGASTLDPQGRQNAQEIRRAVVQALPQEQVVERRWITQGQFYGLLNQRYGSQMETWPNPTRRLQQDPSQITSFPDDPDLSSGGSPATLTGLRPAVQPNESTGFTNRTDSVILPSPNFNSIQNPPPIPVVGQGKPQHFLIDPTFTIDWRLPLGGDVATNATQMFNEKESGSTTPAAVVGGTSYSLTDLRPDGLLLKSSAPLAMELTDDTTSSHGLLRRSSYMPQVQGVTMRSWEIGGRHLSFWVTPHSDWTTGIIPILEAHMPQGQAGGPITMGGQAAATGNTDLQNYIGLFYDTTNKLMVLIFAPPAIEHLADYGLPIAYDDPTTPWLDERCLAISKTGQLAPLAPAQVPDAAPAGTSARLATVTPLFKPNRIVHCYKIPDRTTTGGTVPYFHQNQAVHIQLALANDRPGSSAIIIDGCPGRDVARDPTAGGQMTLFGDHCTLPALPLSTAIAQVNISSTYATGLSTPATITVTPVAGLNAQDLFPARGMIKIDDEYFTYQSITGNTFNACVRGQRQDSNTNDPNPLNEWPTTQAHAVGAYVTYGGYRLSLGYNAPVGAPRNLLTGNCTLGDHLDNGWDPSTPGGNPPPSPTMAWHIWTNIDIKQVPPLMVDPADTTGNTLILFPMAPTPTNIPLDVTQGVPISQWPKRGVILFQGQVLAYSSISGNSLSGITDTTTWTFMPGLGPPLATPMAIAPIRFSKLRPPPVRLLSFEVAGDDPTTSGKFVIPGSVGTPLVQVMNPSGRVEWITYDHIGKSPGQGNYLMVYNTGDAGFGYNTRGQVRTDFVGGMSRNPQFVTTLNAMTDTFPAGSKVLPVQTWFQPESHCFCPGDVVTLLPFQQMQTGSAVPNQLQMVIRYVAIDGYATTAPVLPNQLDTINGWFAFNDPVPNSYTNVSLSNYEFLCWPGWSGDDLTSPSYQPLNPLGSPHGYLPRIDMLAQNYTPGGAAARTFLLATDSQRANAPVAGLVQTADACLDGIAAGPLPAGNALHGCSVAAWVSPASTFNGNVDSQPLLNGIDTSVGAMAGAKIRTLDNIFVTPLGLIMIGGEVFAFDRYDNPAHPGGISTEAVLIGRALLGSTAVAHSGKEFFTILPLGPVARLDQSLPTQPGFFQFYDYMQNGQPHWVNFDAPMAMLMSPSGSSAAGAPPTIELIPVIGPRIETHPSGQSNQPQWPWYLTAPWLRGMYNTVQQTWGPGASGLAPIAVGWWPRYPSAFPQSGLTTQHYRSRSYAWVGFPLSLNETRFDPSTFGSDPVATVSVLDTQTSGIFTIQALAMATGFDWTLATPASITNSAQTDQNVSSAFKYRQFTNVAVNGAELRVMWSYATAPSNKFSDIAAACNSAPMLGPVRLRALAPAKVLTVENAR